MELILVRRVYTPESTTGDLYVDGKFECFTVEDHYPTPYVKTKGKTAIPEGVYMVDMHTESPKFGRVMPRLYNVCAPGGEKVVKSADGSAEFHGVLIHPGNTAEDTEGCLLVGQLLGVNRVDASVAAFKALMPKLWAASAGGQQIFLTIKRG